VPHPRAAERPGGDLPCAPRDIPSPGAAEAARMVNVRGNFARWPTRMPARRSLPAIPVFTLTRPVAPQGCRQELFPDAICRLVPAEPGA